MHKNIYSIIKVFLILTCEKDLFLIEFYSILFIGAHHFFLVNNDLILFPRFLKKLSVSLQVFFIPLLIVVNPFS